MKYVKKALNYAMDKHEGQKYSGKPFIMHPIQVAFIVETAVGKNDVMLSAAYLHDTMEDCGVTYEELKKEFNTEIADLVREVTKTDYNTFPHLKTLNGVILKFSDRLAHLSCVHLWDEERIQKYIEKSKFWKS